MELVPHKVEIHYPGSKLNLEGTFYCQSSVTPPACIELDISGSDGTSLALCKGQEHIDEVISMLKTPDLVKHEGATGLEGVLVCEIGEYRIAVIDSESFSMPIGNYIVEEFMVYGGNADGQRLGSIVNGAYIKSHYEMDVETLARSTEMLEPRERGDVAVFADVHAANYLDCQNMTELLVGFGDEFAQDVSTY
tara:strand:+ start:50743 stop:51321 length:579 start_codon:yes stop_codon:yes gene_type:complete